MAVALPITAIGDATSVSFDFWSFALDHCGIWADARAAASPYVNRLTWRRRLPRFGGDSEEYRGEFALCRYRIVSASLAHNGGLSDFAEVAGGL